MRRSVALSLSLIPIFNAMTRITFLLFLQLLAFAGCFGQDLKRMIFVDSQTGQAIPYVSVKAGSTLLFSDSHGKMSFSAECDSISTHRIGYSDSTFYKLNNTDTLFLNPSPVQLEMVDVSPDKKYASTGFHKSKTNGRTVGKIMNGLGVRFSDLPGNASISKIYAHVNGNKKGLAYRFSVFSIDNSGMPENLIYSEELVSLNGKDQLELELSEPVWVGDQEIAVVFDWVDNSDSLRNRKEFPDLLITFDSHDPRSFFFVRQTGSWHELPLDSGNTWNYKTGVEYVY